MSELAGVSFMVQVGLAAAYGYVYLLYRRPAFLWYAFAWLSAGGFAMVGRVYQTDQQRTLLLDTELLCVLGVCLLMGAAYVRGRPHGVVAIGIVGLILGALSIALIAWRVEPSVMAHLTNALTVALAAILWLNAARFMGLRYDDLLTVLRPEPVPFSVNEAAAGNGLVPAWRELRLTQRLMVLTFAGLAMLEIAYLVAPRTTPFISVLFVLSVALKTTQAGAVGLWVLADMRTANGRLLARSIAEELGVLTASIEHDVRNPLGNLRKEIDTARRMYSANRDICDRLQHMTRSVERIAAAVNVIPTFREAVDDFAHHAAVLNAVAVVRDAVQTIKRLSPSDDVRITVEAARSEFRVSGDQHRLQQSVVNLLNNGVEAARLAGRSPHIEVNLEKTKDRRGVCIRIRDNGVGMTTEQMQSLGRPLYSSKQGANRGIGVFMTMRIVKLHRGTVTFESDGASFTRVEVTLPLVEMSPRAEKDAS